MREIRNVCCSLILLLWPILSLAVDNLDTWAEPFDLAVDGMNRPNDTGAIHLLGSLKLPSQFPDGTPVAELSGLAWDSDRSTLFAVSDQGYLLSFTVILTANRLVGLHPLRSVSLKDADGVELIGIDADSEGLVYDPECECLWVSFERRPRIWAFDLDGRFIKSAKLPKKLRKGKKYRGRNKQLEAVGLGFIGASKADSKTMHLVTLSEKPLRRDPDDAISVWTVPIEADGQKSSQLRMGIYPLMSKNSAVVAIEATGQGDWLVLEREYQALWIPVTIHLRRVALGHGKQRLNVQTLASFENGAGWRMDNFEGLTRLEGDRYLMVSDDNENGFQSTLLTLFEIITTPGH